jgi:lipopolysaccharide/colanic/teichoic acid biosynthesis glycosyltransferase
MIERASNIVNLASVDAALRRRRLDVLPRNEFQAQVRLEKRRADRSKAALSLVVLRLDGQSLMGTNDLRYLIRDLTVRKRETDIIGYVDNCLLAILLPYTDSKSAAIFCRLIEDRVDTPHLNIQSATYPDMHFDLLLDGQDLEDDPEPAVLERVPLRRRASRAIKRIIDIAGALALMVLTSPVMLVTALAVKVGSPGPIIFRQSRMGMGGLPFTFYKFRSMRIESDDRAHREYVEKLIAGQNDEINQGSRDKPVYKMRSDPRITPVGRIIRKTSIDELPQLWNVLKGEMSLVGPRPPVPYETAGYQSWHLRRLQEMRPGITGLWQVEGRSRTTFDDMVRLDLRYVRSWSLWLDMRISFKTVFVVLNWNGAD